MRVLMLTDTVGGVFTYTAELAAALDADTVVATLGPAPGAEQRSRLGSAHVAHGDFALEWMADPWDDVAASTDWLLELEREVAPDVVHLCSYAHGAAATGAPRILVAHSDVVSWWHAVHGEAPPAAWSRYRSVVAAGLRAADAVVAPTAAVAGDLARHHGFPGAVTIHNGSAVAPAAADAAKEPLVLGSGRLWDPAKNLAALDAAAAYLPWPVVVAGDVAAGQAPRHATAPGALPPSELAALRRRAAIYAAPALYEPFGLGILEAALDRCALVLGDLPSLREVWGDSAIYVDPRDPTALRTTLAALIDDPAGRERHAGRAQHRAATFAISRTARAYDRLCMRLRTAVAA